MNVDELLNTYKIIDIKDSYKEIKKIKYNKNSIFIILDDEKIKISDDTYLKYNLKNQKYLDKELYDKLIKESNYFNIYQSVLKKVSLKDYSIKEIKDYLYSKELNKEEIEEIIDKLKNLYLLDDEKYCKNRINLLINKGMSNSQIKYNLKKKGINESLINQYLNIDEDQRIINLINKYDKNINNKSLNLKKYTIINKLKENGYDLDKIYRLIEQNDISSNNEKELLDKEYSKIKRKYEKKYEGYTLRSKIYSYLMSKGFNRDLIEERMDI